MRSLRFLFSRRWALLALAVVLLSYLAFWLGQWQFHRLAERQERNATTVHNEHAEPVPVGDVLAVDRPVAERDEWRLVTATGSYDVDRTVVVRYQTRDGKRGVDVVVPLTTADGTLLVDRGWIASEEAVPDPASLPAPPSGEVTVVGWVRADGEGDSTLVENGSTRSVSSARIGEALGLTVLGGFVDLKSEDPPPDTPLARAELPDLGNGPHFFYGLQWWFFGLLAVGGFGYLAYDEWRRGGRPRAADPASGADETVDDGDEPLTGSAASRRPPPA